MMKRIICIFLLLSIWLPSSACRNENYHKSTTSSNSTEQEIFYGKWVITKCVARNKISTYSKEDTKGIIGKKMVYSEDLIIFNNVILKKPYYHKSVVRRSEFNAGTNNIVTFKNLGIKSESVISVEVYKNSKLAWEDPGSSFFIINKDSLIMIDNGDFFELSREQ